LQKNTLRFTLSIPRLGPDLSGPLIYDLAVDWKNSLGAIYESHSWNRHTKLVTALNEEINEICLIAIIPKSLRI